ncbi:DUF433 domain-containing protein [Aquibaculum sediminis]|uniref:DUF433 domain-containing protein n=1 Tax=Aquibaculum sediminis TaxID=3231907 RepID=UPI0034517806
MVASHLTVKEAAELSGVSTRSIEKATEEGVVRKTVSRGSLRAVRTVHVPVQVVAYASVLKHVRGLHMDLNTKKRLFRCITDFGDELGTFEPMPGVRLAVGTLAAVEWARARSYLLAKGAYLESREDILGGEPVVKGTRITCRSVLGRIEGGDSIDDLCEEHGDIPRAAFEAAITYARTHPPRGRPVKGKPWRA